MKRKPRVGEKLRLYGWAQISRTGFSVVVECLDAFDTTDTILRGHRMPVEKCEVKVRLPNGSEVNVTRGDLNTE